MVFIAFRLRKASIFEAWHYFDEQDIPLFLVRDTPWYTKHNLTCLDKNANAPEDCKEAQDVIIKDSSLMSYSEFISESATAMDVTDYFCDGEYCHYVIGNLITHFDPIHLTATFSRTFAPVFDEPILEALRKKWMMRPFSSLSIGYCTGKELS
ncbi:SGNH hydrolase domain-containing protein [Planococcus sp. CAU13]|uniref:SGNH hydrolase domain-containing protein n=1 Tax=Planococcus sp. CAU13 TaxID=1541197 RepID=UPI00052FE774|nr:SGNH hydrolase domain-containing protein [Planococcus sp. CAU13]